MWVGLVLGDAARLQPRHAFVLLLWGVGVGCVGLLCWAAIGRKPVKAHVVLSLFGFGLRSPGLRASGCCSL